MKLTEDDRFIFAMVVISIFAVAGLGAILHHGASGREQPTTVEHAPLSPCSLCGSEEDVLKKACRGNWGFDRNVYGAGEAAMWSTNGCALDGPAWAPIPHLDAGCRDCGHTWIVRDDGDG